MDPKKQELTPELKQIYDRVMNTQVKPSPAPQQAPTATPPPPQAQQAPNQTSQESFLSSVPPRPVTAAQSFAFSGKTAESQEAESGKKMDAGKIIAAGVVILVIVWAVFWAKFFELF